MSDETTPAVPAIIESHEEVSPPAPALAEPAEAVEHTPDTSNQFGQKYKCHKVVHAAQIRKVRAARHNLVTMEFVDTTTELSFPAEWVEKHNPKGGGYIVIYDGGYTSYSPKEAFEAGYTRIEGGAG